MSHHDIPQQIANGATVAAASTGVYAAIVDNATIISLSLTAMSLCIAILFYILNYRINKKRLSMLVDAAQKSPSERRLSDEELVELRRVLKVHRI